ncbi:MAG: hypothetical protein HQL90_04275 [Magnetococcales bacterium]|nr:hypothetical protein [Magnetococcales bacterium]
MEIPFVGGSYNLASPNVSAQETINLFLEKNKSGKTPVAMYGTPGLNLKVTAGNGPIRAMRVMGSLLYVLSGDTLYSIDTGWIAASLGTVSSSDDGDVPASMDDNGTQLVILIPSEGKAYVYTVAGGLAVVSDADWVASDTVTFMDTYFIFSRTGSKQFHISATGDGTSYNALEFASAEAHPDLLVAVMSIQDRLWLFCEHSIEQWQDTGNATFPFEKIIGGTIERGCAAAGSIAEMDNTVFWLGDDGLVYRAGLVPERISTHGVETAISGYSKMSDARGYTYAQGGHTFYVLTFPAADVTWCYDVATQEWHKRQSAGFGRHRGANSVLFNNKPVVGDFQNGKVYVFDLEKYTDDGDVITRTRITSPISSENDRLFMSRLQIDFQSGVGLISGQGSDPQCMLSWSDDGGHTYGNEHWRSMGKIGEYSSRAIWRRLGRFRQRTFKLTITDPVKVVIIGAQADIQR